MDPNELFIHWSASRTTVDGLNRDIMVTLAAPFSFATTHRNPASSTVTE